MQIIRLFLLAAACVAGVHATAFAATAVEKVNTPYVDRPALPLAPAPGQAPAKGGGDAPAASGGPATGTAPSVAASSEWRIELADGSLSRVMRRWSRDAKFPVLWEAPKDLPVVAATYRGSFLDALRSVMADTQNTEYPMHACAHDNVVRILHVSQSCTR